MDQKLLIQLIAAIFLLIAITLSLFNTRQGTSHNFQVEFEHPNPVVRWVGQKALNAGVNLVASNAILRDKVSEKVFNALKKPMGFVDKTWEQAKSRAAELPQPIYAKMGPGDKETWYSPTGGTTFLGFGGKKNLGDTLSREASLLWKAGHGYTATDDNGDKKVLYMKDGLMYKSAYANAPLNPWNQPPPPTTQLPRPTTPYVNLPGPPRVGPVLRRTNTAPGQLYVNYVAPPPKPSVSLPGAWPGEWFVKA